MDNAILVQILLGIAGLFFIFLTYMNTKTWRWVHVVATFFVFCSTIGFAYYASQVLKTRATWVGRHDQLTKDVEKAKADLELVAVGDPGDIKGESPSVLNLREELARTILDRGRVWRQCAPTPNQDGSVTLQTALPQAEGAGPPPKNNITVKTVVHAFREGQDPGGLTVPVAYIGEFRAVAATDTSVTLAPNLPLSAQQVALVRDPSANWSLYEVAPIDGHEYFQGMDEATLMALIPQAMTGLPNDQYKKLITDYLRDGQPADEATDPPENVWTQVKFKQAYTVPVDAPPIGSVDAEPFNAEGQAQVDRLRVAKSSAQPGQVEFKVGDTAVFDQATANDLISRGIVDKVQPIYRRRLNDYELRFHGIHSRIVEINDRLRTLSLDLAAVSASKDKADQQAALLEDQRTKLTDDLAKVKFELAELSKYGDSVTTRLTEVRSELSQLYRSNKALSRELAAINARLTEEVKRRVRESTAMTP